MMTDEEVKKFPWSALEEYSDKLTPEQFDYCVREESSYALKYLADKLTPEQFDFCVRRSPSYALTYCSDKLSEEQLDYCVRAWPSDALAYCSDKLSEEQLDYCKEKTKLLMKNQKEETLCISCGNQERTVDDTGRCESCRRDLYETDCAMCDFN